MALQEGQHCYVAGQEAGGDYDLVDEEFLSQNNDTARGPKDFIDSNQEASDEWSDKYQAGGCKSCCLFEIDLIPLLQDQLRSEIAGCHESASGHHIGDKWSLVQHPPVELDEAPHASLGVCSTLFCFS